VAILVSQTVASLHAAKQAHSSVIHMPKVIWCTYLLIEHCL
jgi:hypothetical protein